jgi:2,5-diketo-D-gluconate reductase B
MKYLHVKDARVPALGFGTFEITGSQCVEMVRYALEVGYRHIDTAQVYENEAEVGKALRESGIDRREIFLTTKVWMDNLPYSDVKRSTEESLRRLNTEYVDLLLIHWPNDAVPVAATLEAMQELKAQDKIRHIGVSNFTVALLKKAIEVHSADLLCNQVEYHPFLSQRPVLDYLYTQKMMLTAYSPLARGEVVRDSTLKRIGQNYGKSPAQVALRWLLQQDAVAAIPKAASREHCRSNFQIFDFSLSDEEMAAIDKLTGNRRMIDPGWAPEWDAP